MKPPAFDYHAPSDLHEALDLLGELDDAKVLAGGQSLMPLLNMRLVAPAALVDITRVRGLDSIEVDDTHVRVGARVTHERLRRDPSATEAVPLLADALGHVAHTAIRNRGTAVGSIVHADPAAELPAVLVLLGGQVELAGGSAGSIRNVRAAEFFLGPLESDIRPGELATAVVFPRTESATSTAFVELARRHGDYALSGVAAAVTVEAGVVADACVACIGVGPTPVRFTLELAGQAHDAIDAESVAEQLRARIEPDDDVHASATYRRHLTGVLAGRAIRTAAARAAERGAGG